VKEIWIAASLTAFGVIGVNGADALAAVMADSRRGRVTLPKLQQGEGRLARRATRNRLRLATPKSAV